ncbi:MAG: diguanylate cyclase [Desulfobacterales bacterium]
MTFERHRINRRVIDDLKNRSTIGMYFYLAVTIAVLAVDGFYKRHLIFSIIFLSLMAVIACFRVVQFKFYDKFDQINRRLNYCAFFTSVYATALTWGGGFAYFMVQPEDLTSKMIVLASTVGLDAGGVVAFMPSRRTSVIYNLIMLMPAALIMLFLQTNNIIVFLVCLFAAYMILVAFRGNREYWDALENEHLLKLKSEEVEKISRVDVLTGLYNRRYFDEIFNVQWKAAARSAIPLSVIICDIDHFKPVNDTYGHLAGDAYLKKIAQVLSGIFQRDTDFIARYGGEEFVMLLLNHEGPDVVELAEKVRAEVERMTLFYYSHEIKTTISLGISTCVPRLAKNRNNLLEEADKALYQAKNSGRNQVVFYDAQNSC